MYTVDVQKIIGQVAENGFNKTTFAKELGINRRTLDNYYKYPKKIPYYIIALMIIVLHLDIKKAIEIFFTKELT